MESAIKDQNFFFRYLFLCTVLVTSLSLAAPLVLCSLYTTLVGIAQITAKLLWLHTIGFSFTELLLNWDYPSTSWANWICVHSHFVGHFYLYSQLENKTFLKNQRLPHNSLLEAVFLIKQGLQQLGKKKKIHLVTLFLSDFNFYTIVAVWKSCCLCA